MILQEMFPNLTHFSDINWDAVTQEYQQTSIEISFPEYLQQKVLEGDCPAYLSEIAYYEQAAFHVQSSLEPFPYRPGIYLNPTALFLNLEFDLPKMLEDAKDGQISVYERPQILCLYKDREDEIHSLELNDIDLHILQKLEHGPVYDRAFLHHNALDSYQFLVDSGLILEMLH